MFILTVIDNGRLTYQQPFVKAETAIANYEHQVNRTTESFRRPPDKERLFESHNTRKVEWFDDGESLESTTIRLAEYHLTI